MADATGWCHRGLHAHVLYQACEGTGWQVALHRECGTTLTVASPHLSRTFELGWQLRL